MSVGAATTAPRLVGLGQWRRARSSRQCAADLVGRLATGRRARRLGEAAHVADLQRHHVGQVDRGRQRRRHRRVVVGELAADDLDLHRRVQRLPGREGRRTISSTAGKAATVRTCWACTGPTASASRHSPAHARRGLPPLFASPMPCSDSDGSGARSHTGPASPRGASCRHHLKALSDYTVRRVGLSIQGKRGVGRPRGPHQPERLRVDSRATKRGGGTSALGSVPASNCSMQVAARRPSS
jgi:hypothetical protein